MAYPKNPKAGYALATQLVTVKEIAAVSEFIRDFKLKYRKKKLNNKKK